MEKVKKGLGFIPILILLMFVGLYLVYENGYYDIVFRDKIMLTNEQIEKFEQDVIDGKDVTIEDYVEERKDYSNKISKASLSISDKFNHIIDKGIKFIFKKVASVVE